MERQDFESLARFLKNHSGLSLDWDRAAWAESRLSPIAARRGFASAGALARALPAGDAGLKEEVAGAMATCDTGFFRDSRMFAEFRERLLPAVAQAKPRGEPIRIWSAGCSTGQEAYSLAMIVEESAPLRGRQVDILATDISADCIERAADGLYSAQEASRGLPLDRLGKYFQKENGEWRVHRILRSRIRFRAFNLLEPFIALGRFDAIFCRNVLIYFDAVTKADVLTRLCGVLRPGGIMVLGEAEMATGMEDVLAPGDSAGLYAKRERQRRLAAFA